MIGFQMPLFMLPVHDLRGMYHASCGKRHRSIYAVANCVWPNNFWVNGDGPYATVSYCGRPEKTWRWHVSVMLHHDEATARKALERIDRLGCGGHCHRDHQLYMLTDKPDRWATCSQLKPRRA
jgi:hypothetical protein